MAKEKLPELPRWDGPLSHPFYSKVVKRILDFVLAVILLIPGCVIMLPLAIWVKLDSPGPVIYKAVRGGYHNKPFMIYKFRSMVVDADKTGGCTALNDSRVTRAGRIMRRLKLDELPQLFNIVKGDMSFIGPRPELLLYTTQYTPEQQCILWVRPGISDRSSIVYISQDEIVGEENPVENFEKYILPEKNRLRVEYAKTQSFPLDLRLFFETITSVFKKAERVAKEYMSRCPVLQVEDKDTYLLLNKYVFADPYSNVFEYGIYAMKKMKWDRGENPAQEDKTARLKRLLKSLGNGVSGDNEIDKRYEVLMMLSRNLNKEIDKQCDPYLKDKQYVLPLYDSLKLERLTYLINKGQLLGQDAMRLKLAVNKALHTGNNAQVVRDLEVATDLNMTDVRGNYIVAILTVLSESTLDKELINNILSFVLRLRDREETAGGSTNYYNLLGRLYALVGDKDNADKYKKMGDAIEAERMERYKELFEATRSN